MIRQALAVLLLWAGPALAAEPFARLTGPSRIDVNGQVLFSLDESTGDEDPAVELARGPAPVKVATLYDRAGNPIYAVASPPVPGQYLFVLVATGTPEGQSKPVRAYAFHEVTVGDPPPPQPPPGPIPPPAPPEPPKPIVAGPLDVVVIRSGGEVTSATTKAELDAADVVTSATLRPLLQAADAKFFSLTTADQEFASWQPIVGAKVPCAAIVDRDARKVVEIVESPTEASVLSAVNKLRGK